MVSAILTMYNFILLLNQRQEHLALSHNQRALLDDNRRGCVGVGAVTIGVGAFGGQLPLVGFTRRQQTTVPTRATGIDASRCHTIKAH